MSFLQDAQIQSSVYLCTFVCLVREADISMKFPCTYFVQWSTTGGKSSVKTSKHKPQKNHVSFNEKINLTTEMIYNHKTQECTKKEALIELFLVSKSRPDQNKLVGRVTVDLAKIINVQMYAEPTEFKLNFCSVDASLVMQFMLVEQKLTTLKVQDLDRSSFIDYISHVSLKNHKNMPQTLKEPIFNQKPRLFNQQISTQNTKNPDKDQGQQKIVKKKEVKFLNGVNRKEQNLDLPDKIVQKNDQIQKRITFGHQYLLQSKSHQVVDQIKKDQIEEAKRRITEEPQERKKRPLNQSNTEKIMQKLPETLLKQENMEPQPPQKVRRKDKKVVSIEKNIVKDEIKQEDTDFCEQIQKIKTQMEGKIVELRQEFSLKEQQLMQLNQQYLKDIESKNETNNELNCQLQMKDLQCKKFQLLVEEKQNLLKSIHSQSEENNKYEEIIEKYESELKLVGSRIQNYSKEIQNLNKNLMEEEARVQLYEEKFMSLEETIKNLEDKLIKQEQQKQKKESINNELRSMIDQLQSELQVCQNEKNKPSQITPLPSPNDEIQALKSKEAQFERKIKELQAQLDITLQQYQQKKEECQEITEKHNLTLQKLSSQENQQPQESGLKQLTQAQEEINKLNSELEFLRISLQMAEKQSKDLTEEIESLRNQNNDYKLHLQKLQLRCIDLESQTSLTPQSGLQLATEIKPDQEKLQLEEELMSLSTLLSEEKLKNTQLTIQIENNLGKIKFLEVQLSNIEDQNIKSKEIINMMTQQLEKGEEKTSEASKAQEILMKKCSDFEEKIKGLTFSLEQKTNLNAELSETVVRYMDKETKMKETLSILEDESKEIFVLFQQKEHNEETYQKMIEDLQRQIIRMKTNFNEIHSQEPSPNKSCYQSPKTPLKFPEEYEESLSNIKNINIELQEELQKLTIRYSSLKSQYDSLQQIQTNYSRLKYQYLIHCQNQTQLRNTLETIKHSYQTQIETLNQLLQETKLKHQEIQTNSDTKQVEKNLKSKQIELQIMKQRQIEHQGWKNKMEGNLQELKMDLQLIEEEKFGLQSSNNEKEIKILELQEEIYNLTGHIQLLQENYPSAIEMSKERLQEMYSTFVLIKDKILTSNLSSQWDELMKNILERSLLGGEEIAKIINIEEKSRLLSKELQKLKAQIIKSSSRNQQQKMNLMGMIKKCDEIIQELITAAESLNLNQSSFL